MIILLPLPQLYIFVMEIPLRVPPTAVIIGVNIIPESNLFGQIIGLFISQVAHMHSGPEDLDTIVVLYILPEFHYNHTAFTARND